VFIRTSLLTKNELCGSKAISRQQLKTNVQTLHSDKATKSKASTTSFAESVGSCDLHQPI